MKYKRITCLIVASLALTPVVNASGIPTIDIAALIANVKDGLIKVQQFKEKISEAKNRLKQLKATGEHYKEMVDGHINFEDILNDPFLNDHIALGEWKDIYKSIDDISDLRSELDMYSDNPAIQSSYDSKLKQLAVMREFYDMTVERNTNLSNMLDQFTLADNPAAKADLSNSIQFESAQIENDAKMMDTMSAMMEEESALMAEKLAAERMDVAIGSGVAIDYTSAYEGIE